MHLVESATGTFGSNSNGTEPASDENEEVDDDSEYKAEVDEANLAEEDE